MKTIQVLFIALLALMALPACDGDDTEKNSQDDLVGVWLLEQITGGIAGTGYPADFTEVEFKSNGTYRINNNDEAKGEGTYTLTTEEDDLVLRLTSSDSTKIGFEEHDKTVIFEREKLILADPCCDLFEYTFGADEN